MISRTLPDRTESCPTVVVVAMLAIGSELTMVSGSNGADENHQFTIGREPDWSLAAAVSKQLLQLMAQIDDVEVIVATRQRRLR